MRRSSLTPVLQGLLLFSSLIVLIGGMVYGSLAALESLAGPADTDPSPSPQPSAPDDRARFAAHRCMELLEGRLRRHVLSRVSERPGAPLATDLPMLPGAVPLPTLDGGLGTAWLYRIGDSSLGCTFEFGAGPSAAGSLRMRVVGLAPFDPSRSPEGVLAAATLRFEVVRELAVTPAAIVAGLDLRLGPASAVCSPDGFDVRNVLGPPAGTSACRCGPARSVSATALPRCDDGAATSACGADFHCAPDAPGRFHGGRLLGLVASVQPPPDLAASSVCRVFARHVHSPPDAPRWVVAEGRADDPSCAQPLRDGVAPCDDWNEPECGDPRCYRTRSLAAPEAITVCGGLTLALSPDGASELRLGDDATPAVVRVEPPSERPLRVLSTTPTGAAAPRVTLRVQGSVGFAQGLRMEGLVTPVGPSSVSTDGPLAVYADGHCHFEADVSVRGDVRCRTVQFAPASSSGRSVLVGAVLSWERCDSGRCDPSRPRPAGWDHCVSPFADYDCDDPGICVGAGVRIEGALRARGDVCLGPEVVVAGTVVSSDDVGLGARARVHGRIGSREYTALGAGAAVTGDTVVTTVPFVIARAP